MPRRRKGLWMIAPEEVNRAIGIYSNCIVAEIFGVTQRTVRRWRKTGLPLCYGRRPISREKWDEFASTPRTCVDRQMSARGNLSRRSS